MIVAKVGPSWSRLIRLATGVFASKKAVQLAAMTCWAAAPLAEGDDEAGVAAADVLGAELFAAAPEPLLPQAARAAPSAQARTVWESFL